MRLDYTITYNGDREIKCSWFEDAERIAKYLSQYYPNVILTDGELTWEYNNETLRSYN